MVEGLVALLSGLRVRPGVSEFDIHDAIAVALEEARVLYVREAVLGPRARIDFLCEGGVGVEVKKGKPNSSAVMSQAARYCVFDQVTALVLVVERNVFWHLRESHGKPIHYVALNKGWGLAI